MRTLLQAGLMSVALVASLGAQAPDSNVPVDPDAPKLAGSDVPSPKRKKLILPEYPEDAKANGIRGIVLVELVIERDGTVSEASVLRSIPGLDEAALTAVRRWEYEVTKLDGQPVRVRLTVPITFSLKLPEITRADGIPELRSGAAPTFPKAETPLGKASVAADVSLDAEGKVADIFITAGENPWAAALVGSLRTWVFETDPDDSGLLSFKLEADFLRGTRDVQPRVDIRLSSPSRSETVQPPSMSGAAVPSAPVASADAGPAPAPPAAADPTAAPPIETVHVEKPPAAVEAAAAPVPPPPPAPRSTEPGYSSVRDVVLGAGVPDLASGRRPIVPPFARMGNVAGPVTVEFSVGNSGATLVSKVEGPEVLQVAAREMVASWQFRRKTTERLFMTAHVNYGDEGAKADVTLAQ